MTNGKPQIPANASSRQIVDACGGFYTCPKSADGKRLGPLVGYAGRYEDATKVQRQFVGEDYVDFAMIEQWPDIMHDHVVLPITQLLLDTTGYQPLVMCGAPEGGKALATVLAERTGSRYIFPEKVKIEGGAAGERSLEVLKFGRHAVRRGDRVVIVEDVCNNFSTTLALIREIEAAGGIVVAIVCFLNRSLVFRRHYNANAYMAPIIALWDCPMPQWQQHDPVVRADVAAGNVVWKPKLEIAKLQEIMLKAAA